MMEILGASGEAFKLQSLVLKTNMDMIVVGMYLIVELRLQMCYNKTAAGEYKRE